MATKHHPTGDTSGDPKEITALYASGALTAEQNSDFERHLATGCRECLAELAALQPVVDDMISALEPLEVDPGVRDRLMARLDSVPQANAGQTNARTNTLPREHVNAAPINPQVWKQWRPEEEISDRLVRRSGEGQWESTGIDGVEVRCLFNDVPNNRMTAIVRMAPGTSYPSHVHDGPEECYVLQGELCCGEQILGPGDYERRSPGSHHSLQSTKSGCLLLIVSSLSDEMA